MVAETAPRRGSPTAILIGDSGIHASVMACMEVEINSRGEGLVMFIPTSRDASRSSNNSRTIGMPIPLTRMQEETALSAISSLRVPPCPLPVVPLTTTVAKGTQRAVFISSISVTSNIIGDHLGVVHDSATCSRRPHTTTVGQCIPSNSAQAPTTVGQHMPSNSVQALSQCTEINGKRSRTTQKTYRLPDFNELPCSPDVTKVEAKGTYNICKYVNKYQSKVKQNLCSRDAYRSDFGPTTATRTQNSCRKEVHCTASDVQAPHKPADCCNSLCRGPSTGRNSPNWLRAVKPEVNCPPSFGAEESWPPLLACSMKGEIQKQNLACDNSQVMILSTEDAVQPLVKASNGHGNRANMENLSKAYKTPQHGNQEAPLDERCWPSLEKSCRQSHLEYDYSRGRKRSLQPLGSSNFHCHPVVGSTLQGQKRNGSGLLKRENMCMPPILLMLNKDFIVTSPLKENLLLTLALMGRRQTAEDDVQSQLPEGETKRQILVGQFKAFSSFLHFMLGRDATRVRTESNAGGTSTISESLSVEYFVRRFQAKDIVTEMEVEYCSFNWKKVDYICTLYGQRVGVSVTRAMSFPDPKDFSSQMAYRLLYKKLFGLVIARHGVSKRHSFSQCILHVWCETQQTASIMQREYNGVSQELDIADD
eukprot:c18363_g1_i1 orf=2-1942(-)